MAEKVAKIGVKRESGYAFLRGLDVYKTPMKRAGAPSAAGRLKKSKPATSPLGRVPILLDANGDISRALKCVVGGQKRRSQRPRQDAEKKPAAKRAAPAAAARKLAVKGSS